MVRAARAVAIVAAVVFFGATAWASPITGQGDPSDVVVGHTVDFEHACLGTYTELNYDGLHITGDGDFQIADEDAGLNNTRGSQYLATAGTAGNAQSFTVVFNEPVSAFAFLFGASDVEWTLTAYDSEDQVIESLVIDPVDDSNAGDYFGIQADSDSVIAYFTLVAEADSADAVTIDNITHTGAAWLAIIEGEGDPSDAVTGHTVDFERACFGTYTELDYDGLEITGNGFFDITGEFAGEFNTRGLRSLQTFGDEEDATAFTVRFASPVSAFAFLFGASDVVWTLTAYDSDDQPIACLDIDPVEDSNDGDYFGIQSDSENAIAYFTLESTSGTSDYVTIDNITHTGVGTIIDTSENLIEDVQCILEYILPTGDKNANGAIENALDKVDELLGGQDVVNQFVDGGGWIDGNRVFGDLDAFKDLKGAVRNLNFALRMPGLGEYDEESIQLAIEELTEAARLLAATALDDASGYFNDSLQNKYEKWFAKANDYYDKGLGLTESENYFKAVKAFEQAWELCQRLPIDR